MAQRNGAPDKSTPCSPVSSPSTSASDVVVADLGGVQRLRSAEVIDPDAVPDPSAGAVGLSGQKEVARVAGGNVAELIAALDVAGKSPAVFEESHRSPERAARIAARIRKVMETEARLENALTVTRQQRPIAVSDGHKLAVGIADDVRYAARRDATVAQRYAAVVAYAELPAQAVKNGIARKRAAKAKAARKAQAQRPVPAPPDSDKPKG